jgi:plastocyanin
MKAIRLLAAVGMLMPVWAAPPSSAQSGAATQAEIVDFDFAPRDLQVPVGTKVTWTNKGARPHTVSDRGGTFDQLVAPGGRADVTFSVPGRYYFFCRINPGRMNGTITVAAGPQPAEVNRVQATDPARQGDQLRFDPPSLTVQTGSTIVFANVGGKPHTLTADDASFDTGVVTPGPEGGKFAGTNATITVSRPGSFPFHCEVHPVMKGVLTVIGEATGEARAASAAATSANVSIKDFSFDPLETSVAPGGSVTWTNDGEARHTATFDDVSLDTGELRPGAGGQLTAPLQPGSYSYRCEVHPARMRGVLVVVGQNAEDPAAAKADKPPEATRGGGGDGISAIALGTGVVGAFFAGLGIASFGRRRRSPAQPPPPPADRPAGPLEG